MASSSTTYTASWGSGSWGQTAWGSDRLTIDVSGLAATSGLGTVLVNTWGSISDSQTPSWGTIDDSQSITWADVSERQTPRWSTIDKSQTN